MHRGLVLHYHPGVGTVLAPLGELGVLGTAVSRASGCAQRRCHRCSLSHGRAYE